MDISTGDTNCSEAVRRFMDDALQRNPEAAEELIGYVLRRSHQMAKAFNAPHEARAILHVTHSFADELAATNPRFDRLRFIRSVTEAPA